MSFAQKTSSLDTTPKIEDEGAVPETSLLQSTTKIEEKSVENETSPAKSSSVIVNNDDQKSPAIDLSSNEEGKPDVQESDSGKSSEIVDAMKQTPDIDLSSKEEGKPNVQESDSGQSSEIVDAVQETPDIDLRSDDEEKPVVQESDSGQSSKIVESVQETTDMDLSAKDEGKANVQVSNSGQSSEIVDAVQETPDIDLRSEDEEEPVVQVSASRSSSPAIVDIYAVRETRVIDSSSEDEEETVEQESDSSSSSEDEEESAERISKFQKKKPKQKKENDFKGEFDNLPPIEDLTISVPEVLVDEIGEVGWFAEQMVVVRSLPGKPVVNLDTVLFVKRGEIPLGKVFDVFGPVKDPHYCVRFNSAEHITERDIKPGMKVYFCPSKPEYTSLVFLSELTKLKPCEDNGEDEDPQFSDDEEEQAYKASKESSINTAKSKNPTKSNNTAKNNINTKGSGRGNVRGRGMPYQRGKKQGGMTNNSRGQQHHGPNTNRPNPFYQTNSWSRQRYQQPNNYYWAQQGYQMPPVPVQVANMAYPVNQYPNGQFSSSQCHLPQYPHYQYPPEYCQMQYIYPQNNLPPNVGLQQTLRLPFGTQPPHPQSSCQQLLGQRPLGPQSPRPQSPRPQSPCQQHLGQQPLHQRSPAPSKKSQGKK